MEEQDFFSLNSIAGLPEPAKQNVRAILSAHPNLFPRFSATVETYIDEYVQIMSGGIEIGNNKLHGAELSKKMQLKALPQPLRTLQLIQTCAYRLKMLQKLPRIFLILFMSNLVH